MSLVQGTCTDKFSAVKTAFEESLRTGADLGASVAVYHHGELVVDLWGGYKDAEKTQPWLEDTIVNVWSSTKTMTFLVALMLCDQGLLDFDAPVAKYWPEFAVNGKENIKVLHLMNHSSGLSGWATPLSHEDVADWEKCVSILEKQSPWWEPGTRTGYHALSQGHLIGEVVRRITGMTFGQYFKKEVADVLNADFHIGTPKSEFHRISPLQPPPPFNFDGVSKDSVLWRTLHSAPLDANLANTEAWISAEVPAANGHGNARSIALIQSIIANRGEINGRRFFSEALSDQMFTKQITNNDLVLNGEFSFGLGYGLETSVMPIGPDGCFWGGYGGSSISMNRELGLTTAYMMNKMEMSALYGDMRGPTIGLHALLSAMS